MGIPRSGAPGAGPGRPRGALAPSPAPLSPGIPGKFPGGPFQVTSGHGAAPVRSGVCFFLPGIRGSGTGRVRPGGHRPGTGRVRANQDPRYRQEPPRYRQSPTGSAPPVPAPPDPGRVQAGGDPPVPAAALADPASPGAAAVPPLASLPGRNLPGAPGPPRCRSVRGRCGGSPGSGPLRGSSGGGSEPLPPARPL